MKWIQLLIWLLPVAVWVAKSRRTAALRTLRPGAPWPRPALRRPRPPASASTPGVRPPAPQARSAPTVRIAPAAPAPQPSLAPQPSPAPARATTAPRPSGAPVGLAALFGSPSSLAAAVVAAEILGPPLALRPPGTVGDRRAL